MKQVIALLGISLQIVSAAAPVEMITDTTGLQPASTLEFRFAKPMIARDDVGIAVAIGASPVVIMPAVGGNFTWIMQRCPTFISRL